MDSKIGILSLFQELYGVFSNRTYDSLDPVDQSFIKDYEHFKSRTFELDRKLGAVLGRAFDDCLVTESIFKLLQVKRTRNLKVLLILWNEVGYRK